MTPQALAAELTREQIDWYRDDLLDGELGNDSTRAKHIHALCDMALKYLDLTAARAGAREEAAKVADYFADKWKRLRDEQADVADKVIYNERWDASATIAESIRRLAARKAGSEG
jgi:hypothetical protein